MFDRYTTKEANYTQTKSRLVSESTLTGGGSASATDPEANAKTGFTTPQSTDEIINQFQQIRARSEIGRSVGAPERDENTLGTP